MGGTTGRNERGLDAFIALTQKYVDVEELTPTIVNEYIKKIVVYAPDKSSGRRTQKVKIYFNFVDDVDIPVISEPVITKTSYERRKRACRTNSPIQKTTGLSEKGSPVAAFVV